MSCIVGIGLELGFAPNFIDGNTVLAVQVFENVLILAIISYFALKLGIDHFVLWWVISAWIYAIINGYLVILHLYYTT